MKTQFIVSLLGVIVSGLAFLFVAGRILLRKYKKQPVSIPANIVLCFIILTAGAFSGYKLLEASYDLAIRASKKVADAGQKLITATVDFGTVSILEGFGKTADHFNEKWREETLAEVKTLQFTVVSCEETKNNEELVIHLVLGIKNTGGKPVDFNSIVEHQHILLKDSNGMCYPLNQVKCDNSLLPAGVTSVRTIDITLPHGISPTLLVTPDQEVSLHKK